MNDWRSIEAAKVDWSCNPISRLAGHKVRTMCSEIFRRYSNGSDREAGGWSDKTLGEIADLGEAHWRRCSGIGELGVKVIKWMIDEAAEGRCRMLAGSGAPAPDAYVPRSERNDD